MTAVLSAKVAAFCAEIGDNTLLELARRQNKAELYDAVLQAIRGGVASPQLEAGLDEIDAMVRQAYGEGLYTTTRYTPLPPYPGATGAQWWTCPRGLCAGRGRVRPGQQPPVCAATGNQLVPAPLPR